MSKHGEEPDKDKKLEAGQEAGLEAESNPEDEAKETKARIESDVADFSESSAGQARPDAVDKLKEVAETSEEKIDRVVEGLEAETANFETVRKFVQDKMGKDLKGKDKAFMDEAKTILERIKTVEAHIGESTSGPMAVQFHKDALVEAYERYYGENAQEVSEEPQTIPEESVEDSALPENTEVSEVDFDDDDAHGDTFAEQIKDVNVKVKEVPLEDDEKSEEPVVESTPEKTPQKEERDNSVEGLEKALGEARQAYMDAIKDRRKAFNFKARKFGVGPVKEKYETEFKKLKDDYMETVQALHRKKLWDIKEKIAEESKRGEVGENLFKEYLALLEAEEAAKDGIATSSEKNALLKFQEWWKRTSKARMVAGLAMGATGLALTFTGVGAAAGAGLFGTGFALARGTMSGAGTYMFTEGIIDRKSKSLGQKGLIDEVVAGNKDDMDKKGIFKKKAKDAESIEKIVEDAEKGKNIFEEYSLDQISEEIARLRALSLDKGVSLAEAGRYGKSQEKLINLLVKAQHAKLKEAIHRSLSESEDDKEEKAKRVAGALSGIIDNESTWAEHKVSNEADRNRLKAMKRHGIAAAVGIGIGAFTGSRLAERLAQGSEDTASQNAEKVKHLFKTIFGGEDKTIVPEGPITPSAPESVSDHAKHVNKDSWGDIKRTFGWGKEQEIPDDNLTGTEVPKPPMAEMPSHEIAGGEAIPDVASVPEAVAVDSVEKVSRGDSIWALAKRQLIKRIGQEQWDGLDEAKRTYLIDSVENKVVADPGAFGIDGNPNNLGINQEIDFSKIFEDKSFLGNIQEGANSLSAEQSANILANNEALEKAAGAGIKITTDNVDDIAHEIRQHGVDFISKDGQIHEWTMDGQAVVQQGDHFVVAETGQSISAENLQGVVSRSGENAEQFLGKQAEVAVQKYLSAEGGTFSGEMYNVAKETGKLNDVFEKILKNGSDKDIETFITQHFGVKEFSPSKTKVFLSIFSNTEDIKPDLLNHSGDVGRLDEWVARFDQDTADSFSKLKEATDGGEWAPARIKDHYALVRKFHTRSLGGLNPWKADHYQVDFMDGKDPVLYNDDDLLKQAFERQDWGTASTETATTKVLETPEVKKPEFSEIGGARQNVADVSSDKGLELPGKTATHNLEMPADSKVEVDNVNVEKADVQAETVETDNKVDAPVEKTPEISQAEHLGTFKGESGAEFRFNYDDRGNVVGVDTLRQNFGPNKFLSDDYKGIIIKKLTSEGMSLDQANFATQKASMDVDVLKAKLFGLVDMEDAGKIDTPEGQFLKEATSQDIARIKKEYGDILRDF